MLRKLSETSPEKAEEIVSVTCGKTADLILKKAQNSINVFKFKKSLKTLT